jgi:hypothetical protein
MSPVVQAQGFTPTVAQFYFGTDTARDEARRTEAAIQEKKRFIYDFQ